MFQTPASPTLNRSLPASRHQSFNTTLTPTAVIINTALSHTPGPSSSTMTSHRAMTSQRITYAPTSTQPSLTKPFIAQARLQHSSSTQSGQWRHTGSPRLPPHTEQWRHTGSPVLPLYSNLPYNTVHRTRVSSTLSLFFNSTWTLTASNSISNRPYTTMTSHRTLYDTTSTQPRTTMTFNSTATWTAINSLYPNRIGNDQLRKPSPSCSSIL